LNNNFAKSQMPGGLPGGRMLKLGFDRYIRVSSEPHARRACEARGKNVFLASLPSLALRFQPPSRPFV